MVCSTANPIQNWCSGDSTPKGRAIKPNSHSRHSVTGDLRSLILLLMIRYERDVFVKIGLFGSSVNFLDYLTHGFDHWPKRFAGNS